MLRSFFTSTIQKRSISSKLVRNKGAASSIKDELLSNPEFDQAFPHLSQHKPNTQLPKDKKELDFIRSLFYRWRTTGKVDAQKVIENNVRLN